MLRTGPTHVHERRAEGMASAVQAYRSIARRNAKRRSGLTQRGLLEFDALEDVTILGFQGVRNIKHTLADGMEERLVGHSHPGASG